MILFRVTIVDIIFVDIFILRYCDKRCDIVTYSSTKHGLFDQLMITKRLSFRCQLFVKVNCGHSACQGHLQIFLSDIHFTNKLCSAF